MNFLEHRQTDELVMYDNYNWALQHVGCEKSEIKWHLSEHIHFTIKPENFHTLFFLFFFWTCHKLYTSKLTAVNEDKYCF